VAWQRWIVTSQRTSAGVRPFDGAKPKDGKQRGVSRTRRRAASPTTRSARFSFGFGDHTNTSWHHVSQALNNDGAQHPTQEIVLLRAKKFSPKLLL